MDISLSNLLGRMEDVGTSPLKINKLEFKPEFIDKVTRQELYSQYLELNLPHIDVIFETEE